MRVMPADVRVLGPVEVVATAGPIRLPAKQARLLAALVVAHGRPCSVDELVEAVWDQSTPTSARKLIRVYVSQLRKALTPELQIATVDSGYVLELDPGILDAERFERLLGECVAARADANAALAASFADRALALWSGRAFGELAYVEFARVESERLEELKLVAVEERLAARLELGRHDQVLGEALAFADEHAYRERAHELAMLALYRSGRQADALDHYASIRARFDDELGLEPGQRLRDLQRRILQQDPELGLSLAAVGSRVETLFDPPNSFVGRESELRELRALLDRRESRLVALTGAGGSGKTRLALEVARQVAGSYANGVAFVELAPLRDAALVLPTIAQALEVSLEDNENALDALADALARRELLLVVDNVEHVREAARNFAALVARAPRVTVLVTSRAVLHVSGEHVFPVAPLVEDDAVQLFVLRAALLDPSFELTPDNELGVRELCRRVDCLPLAVELAASRIRTLTIGVLKERLGARLGLLTGGPRDLPARQQTLRSTIAWSIDLLPDRAQQVFARLAVFPAGATLEAVERVCRADLDTLATLVDDHVVRRLDVGDELRYGLLETLREYALELLGDEQRETALAMARYLAELAESVELEVLVRAQALARLDPEIDNVRAALSACAEAGDADLELRLAGGIWRYWLFRGAPAEGIKHIERALASAGDNPPTAARAQALWGAAGLAWVLGDLERAKELAHAAIPVAVAVSSTRDEMAAHTVLGVVANVEGDRAAARRHHLRSKELSEELGQVPIVQMLNLGVVALDAGDFEEARVMFQAVLEIHRANTNIEGIGTALLNLGAVYFESHEHEASLEAFEEAHSCFQEIGFRAHIAHALQGFAAYEASRRRFEAAAHLLGRARGELDDIGAPESDFAEKMVAWTKRQVIDELGQEVFAASYAAGHNARDTPGHSPHALSEGQSSERG